MPNPITTGSLNLPFTIYDMAAALEEIPNTYGLVRDLNLFPNDSINTTIVQLDSEAGQIYALPVKSRGAPGTPGRVPTPRATYIELAHVPHTDTILPGDIQNVRQLGTQNLESAAAWMAKRLQTYTRPRHDVTREVMRVGALKGLVVDGTGATILDLYAEFGVTKTVIAFDLDNAASDVIGHCQRLFDHMADNVRGSPWSGVEVIVGGTFFGKLIQHPKVADLYKNYEAAQQIANAVRDPRAAYGREFVFQNIKFREYNWTYSPWDANTNAPGGSSVRFVAADRGHAYPTGTINLAATFNGPPNTMDMVNQAPPEGDYIHITEKVLDHGQGVELLSQSNLMPIHRQPAVLVELRAGAS